MRPLIKHMDFVGHDVLQEPLIMRDDDHGPILVPQCIDAIGHGAEGVDVQAGIGLVENAQPGIEHRHLEDFVAFLLAAGKAFVDGPLEQIVVDVQHLQLFLDQLEEANASRSGRPLCLRTALTALRRK